MDDNLVVHFGAGALGRGLVVPILVESEKNVVLVDSNEDLVQLLKNQKGYQLTLSDVLENKQFINIVDSISPIKEENKVIAYLNKAKIVTTSVRRENLIHVAKVVAKAWKNESCNNRKIICCENVEHVGSIFKNLLLEQVSEKEAHNLKEIMIPDTIVDRICAVDHNYHVTSEQFYELSVDKKILKTTGIRKITSIDNITGHFYRKRYLLNSYADAISFIALSNGFQYLYEAAIDEDINNTVASYIELLKTLLHVKYKIDTQELHTWFEKYRKRLINKKIPRELETVARNLDTKLSLEERFISPIVELEELGYDYSKGLDFIKLLIHSNTLIQLEKTWCHSECGKEVYKKFKKQF